MCRLLGVIANEPVDFTFSMLSGPKTLKQLSETNPDGWGIGWYQGAKLKIHKEPIPANKSRTYSDFAKSVAARIIIAHVRKATVGKNIIENCHPFEYGGWLFAHNGSLDRERLMDLLEPRHMDRISGHTDSEVFFHFLLQNIEAEKNNVAKGVSKAISFVKKGNHKGLNFLLSDGKNLFAFRDAKSNFNHYSLFYLRRPSLKKQLLGLLELRSKEVRSLLQSRSLGRKKAILVCSEKLTDESWKEIPVGGLLSITGDLKTRCVRI